MCIFWLLGLLLNNTLGDISDIYVCVYDGFPFKMSTELSCSPSPPLCSARIMLSSYRCLKCVSVTHKKSHIVAKKITFRRATKRKEGKAKVQAQTFFFFENNPHTESKKVWFSDSFKLVTKFLECLHGLAMN